MKITVWNEFAHEKSDPAVKAIYPDGIHAVIASFLRDAGYEVRTATLDDPEHLEAIRFAVEQTKGRIPVIAGHNI